MRKTLGRKTEFWSAAEFWKHADNQVVGQIFFPSTKTIDVYKLEFNEANILLLLSFTMCCMCNWLSALMCMMLPYCYKIRLTNA